MAMHEYYTNLRERANSEAKRDARYDMMFGPIFNFFRKFGLFGKAERGNCAYWTSKGLVAAGLIDRSSMWPKLLWVRVCKLYVSSNFCQSFFCGMSFWIGLTLVLFVIVVYREINLKMEVNNVQFCI
jgi:hypothetical protein